MRDWATSGRIKIDRANEHIRYLETEILAFRERRPYPVVRESNTYNQGVYKTYGTAFDIHVREEIPPMWSAVAADAIHNLNVALDYLWQRAVWGAKSARRYHFPIYADAQSAKARFKGEPNRRMKRVVDILFRVNAFEEGNPFWTIRRFDDTDKHDTMALVAHSLTGMKIDTSAFPDLLLPQEWAFLPGPSERPYVIEEGAQLYSLRFMPEVDLNPELVFEIAFGEGEVLKGEAVVPTLDNLLASVESLAAALTEKGLLK
jgi:hypothetical protein